MNPMNAQSYDIAIFGGGPVGTALALLVAARSATPERVLVLDRQTEAQSQADPRVIALSAGSLQLLERVAPIAELQAAPITRITLASRAFQPPTGAARLAGIDLAC